MTYVRKHARFSILDDVPCDVWEEPEHQPNELLGTTSDPDKYLCIVGDEPADYDGNFCACTFTRATYQGAHVPVSAEYLRDRCTLAPEETARMILAHYLRVWAIHEDDDAAEILRDEADRIAQQ